MILTESESLQAVYVWRVVMHACIRLFPTNPAAGMELGKKNAWQDFENQFVKTNLINK